MTTGSAEAWHETQPLEGRGRRLAALVDELTSRNGEGQWPSAIDGVSLSRACSGHRRAPVLYEPSLYIVAQGRKIGFIGDRRFVYDPNNYLVLSVPLPFECQTEPGPDGPLLGISIRVNPTLVTELAVRMDRRPGPVPSERIAFVEATPLDGTMSDAVVRLLECLRHDTDAAILGPAVVREIVYRAICGPQGPLLLAMVGRQGHSAQIHAAMRRMHAHYAERLSVQQMAGEIGMSVSAFHHHFKAVTASSPVQYLKSIRLHKARLLIVNDGTGAATAALRVGYESASQFSREFKRFFGNSPKEEVRRIRQQTGSFVPSASQDSRVS